MAETGKKVEVRYGAFACTIEGYDNPAEQLEAILGKMQAMIASTPQFSQVASGSEARDIQDALHPENSDEAPSPGIVIIRDSDDRSSAAKDDEAIVDAEEVSEPASGTSAEEGEPDVEEVPDSDRSEPTEDFEPFEAPMADAETGDEHEEAAETSETPAYAAAAATLATGALAAGAATFSMADSDADTPEYAADRSEAEDAEAGWPEEPVEEASASDHWDAPAEENGPADVFSPADDASQDEHEASDADAAVNIFAAAETDTTEPGPAEQDTIAPEAAAVALSDATNIFASPDTDPPGDVNIFAASDAEEALTEDATDAADADATPAEQPEEATAPNIFAEPEAEEEVNIFADAETAEAVNIFASAEPEPEPKAAPSPEPEPEPEPSVASASETVSWLREHAPAEDPVANIFAAPDAGPETDLSVLHQVAEDAATETEETPFNIFGAPAEDVVAEIEEQTAEVSHSAADVWNAATDALEQATPDTVQDTLDSLGEQVSRFATNTDAGADAEPSSSDTGSAFSIFAAPEEDAKAPAVPASEPDTDPAQQTNNRFQALLRGNQGGPVMGAPGEPTASDAPPSALSELAPGITSPHDLAQRAGSDSVADLLAASAAWLTLAEGKARFSRRDVMDVFEKIPGGHSRTLEARIKGYGKLVRSGMLVLVDDGVFAMAQSERQRFQTMLDRG